jgi:hypothetical protein
VRLVDRTIYFYGDDLAEIPLVRSLCAEEKKKKRGAVSREAMWFSPSEIEPCDRVVLMPSVRKWHTDKIIAAYDQAKVPIERFEGKPEAANGTVPVDAEMVLPDGAPSEDMLRRLPNRELRELARARGVDVSSHRDRITTIKAILEAAAAPQAPQ